MCASAGIRSFERSLPYATHGASVDRCRGSPALYQFGLLAAALRRATEAFRHLPVQYATNAGGFSTEQTADGQEVAGFIGVIAKRAMVIPA